VSKNPEPRPGFIYIGRTGSGKTKLGRTARAPAMRERELKTGDPDFVIIFAYPSEDVVEEEWCMHAKLRVVAGTDYTGPGREVYDLPVEAAIATVSEKTAEDLAAEANAAVLACELKPGLTVGAALRWICGEYETYDEKTMDELYLSLKRIGLVPHLEPSGEEGLAHIRWLDKLVGAYPCLARYRESLADLPVLS
jgi:hypothetical protein